MNDSYDYASAIKDVDRAMPEASREIRAYIKKLEAKIPQEVDHTAERECTL